MNFGYLSNSHQQPLSADLEERDILESTPGVKDKSCLVDSVDQSAIQVGDFSLKLITERSDEDDCSKSLLRSTHSRVLDG